MKTSREAKIFPTLYIPHGGGPCFFMDWTMGPADTWDKMENWLRGLADSIGGRPTQIVVCSAHWEGEQIRINASPQPPLIYDYNNFPPHTYQLEYPAPGSPQLAGQIQSLLIEAGIKAELDVEHGLDHGTFIPFKLIYPDADIPLVQISLRNDLDPAHHLAVGRALSPLRQEGTLIVGSGMSYHNMQTLMTPGNDKVDALQFDSWLRTACANKGSEREQLLCHWQSAPAAREAHPREEHLLPLMVAAGAAGNEAGIAIYRDQVLGAQVSAIQFGESLTRH
ncbi:MAG: dioxygenase [Gammaproteobacteria bacterium]|nr:dioxygenase [Gammaproteobacteria bacterium]MBQ0840229.1 dioxygenase [Gammaproteobacteria bacterium]